MYNKQKKILKIVFLTGEVTSGFGVVYKWNAIV